MSNEGNDKDSLEWESPWSSDKIRSRTSNWTLAGDSGLLNRLELFSENMLCKATNVQKNMNCLVRESKASHSRINNSINEFLMLANTQFVENRVYDEEITEDSPVEKKSDVVEKTKEQKEMELVSTITDALNLGLKVIDDAFEKHEVVNSDSEDEAGSSYITLPVLEPKDPYFNRPLPYIIGSDKFMSDDKVGLSDLFSDDDGEESEKESITESDKSDSFEKKRPTLSQESDSESEISSEVSKSESPLPTPSQRNKNSLGSDLQEDRNDMFGSESSSNSNSDNEEVVSPAKSLVPKEHEHNKFSAELAAKLGVTSPIEQRKGSIEKTEKPSSQKQTVEIEDDDDSVFGRRDGLFSSPKGGLFDDDFEQEDLFSNIIKSNTKKEKKKGDASDSENSRDSISSSSYSSRRETAKSLFDNDESDEADLFVDKPNSIKGPVSRKSQDLFDDGNSASALFTEPDRQNVSNIVPKKTLPAGAVSLFGDAVNPLTEAIRSRRLPDMDDEVQSESSDSTKEQPLPAPSEIKISRDSRKEEEMGDRPDGIQGISKPKATLSLTLFDSEDSDDGIFSTSGTQAKGIVAPLEKKSSLFDEDLFGSSHEESPSVDLFKHNDNKIKQSLTKTLIERVDKKSSPSTSLFSSDDEDDIFSSIKKEQKSIGKPPIPTPRKTSLPQDELKSSLSKEIAVELLKPEFSDSKKVPEHRNDLDNKVENKNSPSRKFPEVVPDVNPPKDVIVASKNISAAIEKRLLPQAMIHPPSVRGSTTSEMKEAALSFEEPVEVNPLPNAAKVRPKVQVKRRLPTRKGRLEAVRKSQMADDETDSTTKDVAKTAAETQEETSSHSLLKEIVTSPSTEEEDLFSLSEPVLVPLMTGKMSKPAPRGATMPVIDDDTNESPDILQNILNGLPDSLPKQKTNSSLFERDGEHEQMTKECNDKENYSDLFSSASQVDSTSKHKVVANDLFVKVPEEKKGKLNKPIFEEDSDSDDLFADLMLPKKKVASSANSATAQQDRRTKVPSTLFGDIDDDLDIFSNA